MIINELDQDPFVCIALRRYGQVRNDEFDGRATATVFINGIYFGQACAYPYYKWHKITDNMGNFVKLSRFGESLKGSGNGGNITKRINVRFRQILINDMDIQIRKYDNCWRQFNIQ